MPEETTTTTAPPTLPATTDPFLSARLDSLFDFADAWAAQMWPNDKFRYLAWLSDPTASAEKKAKINENVAWGDAIWLEYLRRKALVLNGGEVDGDFSSFGAPPYSFLDVAMTP
jgi:hypothetical protein